MVYVFLANGFEEMEAIAPIDRLRRAELKVVTVAVGTDTTMVTGAHGIRIHADITEQQVDCTGIEMAVLPGGMPGTLHLEQSAVVQTVLKHCKQQDIPIGAICAAPSILGHMGLLRGITATCFEGFETQLTGANYSPQHVCCDQNVITARGAGVSVEFALKLVEVLCGASKANLLRKSIQCM